MIELGYNFLKKDLDKIQKFKNPTLDINKNKLNKNSKYKIFLNKTQFNNLLDQGFIKYKCVLFCLYKVDSKNKFISFLNLFNSNNFLKNELI